MIAGETVEVTAEVENVGETGGTQNVTLSARGMRCDSTSVTLGPGNAKTVTLTWATSASTVATVASNVASANATDTTGVTTIQPFGAVTGLDRCRGDSQKGDRANGNDENGGCGTR